MSATFSTRQVVSAAFAAIVCAACLAPEASHAQDAARLTVTITNVQSEAGTVYVAMVRADENWLSNEALIESKAVAPAVGAVTLTFETVPVGEIAIRAYHDVNANDTLDTGMFGIPKEPYGFSNDAPVRFGPPSFEDAAVALSGGENTHTFALR